MIEAFHDADGGMRYRTVCALGMIGPAAVEKIEPAAVPGLIEALRHADDNVREYAAHALEKMGLAATEAVPGLTEALRDTNSNVRRRAANALEKIRVAASPKSGGNNVS